MSLLNRFWNSIFPHKLNKEVQQELETHLSLLEDEAVAQGLSQKDARAEARRRFGSQSSHFEGTRNVNLSVWLDQFGQDTRFAFRQIRKNPAFTAIAALVMALGIGAVTTIFSLVHAVLINSLPYDHAEQLVYLWTPNTRWIGSNIPQELAPSYPDFYDWQRLSHSFSSLTMLRHQMLNLVDGSTVERIGGASVTADFFKTLDIKPALGRTIDKNDDQPGRGNVAVISDALWRDRFAGERDAIGKTLQLNREKYTVIGVMPKAFGYPIEGDVPYVTPGFGRTDVWLPIALPSGKKSDRSNFDSSDAAIARLRPGVSGPQAQAELIAIERQLDPLYPNELKGWTALVTPLVEIILGPVSKMLWLMLGAVVVVLLIACSNVANLLLARVTGRVQEIGIRAGLGAGSARLVRQMVTESLVLSCIGGALGVVVALGAVRLLVRLNPGNIPRFDQTSINLPVLIAAAAISVVGGLLFSLAPVLATSRVNLNELLKQGGNKGVAGSSNRLRHGLVVAEIALSFVLLAGATLLIRSYLKLQAQDPGFSGATLTMDLQLDGRYSKPEQRVAFFKRFLEDLRNVPGITKAGVASDLPLDYSESIGQVEIKGYGVPKEMVDQRWVTPGYFDALGMHLLAGRSFDEHDAGHPNAVVIVNRAFVNAYMRRQDPLRGQVRGGSDVSTRPWATIVGIVSDLRHSTLEERPRPEYFQPYGPAFDAWRMHFAIRSQISTEQVIAAARKVLHNLDPTLAFDDVRTMSQRVAQASARRRFQMVLLSAFAAIAIFLAMIGIYGVMAYSVRQRKPEIGLRMALGASGRQVITMIMQQGLTLVATGLIVGIGSALVLTRSISSWLYGISPKDPFTFFLIPLLIIVVASCACILPALDATGVDPAIAIRNE